ncbi:MAG: hypothetical protein SPH20_06380, partial [Eubacterium sp.]|nr:hypothetical protein [Eubacterium sp.]
NLEKIGHCAFAGAPLETFYIQKTVKSIGVRAFDSEGNGTDEVNLIFADKSGWQRRLTDPARYWGEWENVDSATLSDYKLMADMFRQTQDITVNKETYNCLYEFQKV